MSVIAVQPIIPTNPEEKCVICQYSQAETPNQEWVGHSLSEKIIENGKEIEKLKWAHNFHRECLVETAKTGYSLCPGACGNSVDHNSLFSQSERFVALMKKRFKHVIMSACFLGGESLAAVPALQRTESVIAGFTTIIFGIILAGGVAAIQRHTGRSEAALGISVGPILLGALLGNIEIGMWITIAAVITKINFATIVSISQKLGISEDEVRIFMQNQIQVLIVVTFLTVILSFMKAFLKT